jgi:HEAT repeat protein
LRAEGEAPDITPPPKLEPGEATAREDTPPSHTLRSAAAAPAKKRKVIAIAVVATLIAGGAVAATRIGGTRDAIDGEGHTVPARESPVAAASKPVAADVASDPGPAAPAAPDPQALLAEAKTLLQRTLGDESARVRLLAAMALSRSGDAAALAELRKLLAEDPSEIRRLEVAYGLARAGDATGTDYLVAALRGSRRDIRLEAARSLARLGDARGRERLREALGLTTHKLGAAEFLARLGDAEGIDELRAALKGKNEEFRMRAAVALGRAGDPSGVDVLKTMAAESRVEMGYAQALARLGDKDAIPLLERHLTLSALRVEAAISLRQLGVNVDLSPLAAAMAAGDTNAKVTAAEAVMILVGPETPAELR